LSRDKAATPAKLAGSRTAGAIWLFEISDHKTRFVGPYGKQASRDLDRAIKRDELFEACLDLAQVQTRSDLRDYGGSVPDVRP
jgi:hypothetical protein